MRLKIKGGDYGFTLIELVVSITIFVILAVVLVLRFGDYYYKRNLQDDSLKIAFALKSSRDKAISQEGGTPWGIHFVNTSGAQGYYIIFSGPAYAGQIFPKTELNPGVQFLMPVASSTVNIVFLNPFFSATSTYATPFTMNGVLAATTSIIIALTDDETSSSTIIINANGDVQY
ncbi:MAG: prepilin-type N-terminal cleavage/methylation domain-containing protein [Candidatus Wolfebacteria bacterium]|nr:prepilin-type N-terminal cleavage/methylation domain-containing protein [Candidatus Wolfebacteria bacterium]